MLKLLNYEPPALTKVFERYRIEQNLKRGHLANLKGRTAEERVLRAAEHLSLECSWIQSCRLATKIEDAKGIDVVVETYFGPLYIQVKSSRRGVRHYKQKRRKARVIIVVIEPEMQESKVRDKVSGALHVQRNHILTLRKRSALIRKQKARP
jgi:hypothetical protein